MINKWNFELTHEINASDSLKNKKKKTKKKSGLRPDLNGCISIQLVISISFI